MRSIRNAVVYSLFLMSCFDGRWAWFTFGSAALKLVGMRRKSFALLQAARKNIASP